MCLKGLDRTDMGKPTHATPTKHQSHDRTSFISVWRNQLGAVDGGVVLA